MDVIISIKPQYVKRILDGIKNFEYRKSVPKQRFNRVYIYESAPTKKIVAYFKVKRIFSASPNAIWNDTFGQSGLSRKDFDSYFLGKENAYALEISELHVFKQPISPQKLWPEFKAPQSFCYVEGIKKNAKFCGLV